MLNKEQQEVVDSTADKILVLAGAGTGKTHCMLERIKKVIRDGAAPTSILVLTFTNAAAYNMDSRFKGSGTGSFRKLSPEFKTFHAFCYSLIASNLEVRKQLGYSKVPNIILDAELLTLKRTVKEKYNIKLSDAKLSSGTFLSKSEQFQFDLYKKCLKRELIETNKITFDMLCYDVCELFVSNHTSIRKYFDQYKYIFVDEFQDTDSKQWKFVQSFKDSKLYIVGDALQSLYAFRGADSSIIKSLAVNPEWTTYRLHRNYRSTVQICDYANENSTYANDNYRVAIDTDREGDSVTVMKIHDGRDGYDQKMMSNIKARCKNLHDGDTLAVLCRTNAEVYDIKEYLTNQGIQVSSNDMDKKLVKNLMLTCTDDYQFLKFLSSELTNEDYAEYLRIELVWRTGKKVEENKDNFDIQTFLTFFQNRGMSKAIKLMNQIHSIMWNKDYDYLIMYSKLLDLFHFPYKKIDPSTLVTVDDLINAICDVIDNLKDDTNIYVGTIHSSKGLEYDEVHLVNVGGKSFRVTSEDNHNVFYVGITRAKNQLFVYEVV